MPSQITLEKRTPIRDHRASRAVRDSVYNVFLELGGMQEHSAIAELMFNEESDTVELPTSNCRGRGMVHFAETNSGSRFRESFDSDLDDGDLARFLEDDVPVRRPRPTRSRSTKFLERVRSKSRSRPVDGPITPYPYPESSITFPTRVDTPPPRRITLFDRRRRAAVSSATEESLRPSSPLSKSRRPFTFFRSKSSTNVPVGSPEPSSTRTSSHEGPTTPIKSSLSRFIIDPSQVPVPLSRAPTIDDDEWEHMSALTLSPTVPAFNPFMQGSTDALKVPTSDASLFRKFSLRDLVKSAEKQAPGGMAPLRRVHSDSRPPVRAPPAFFRSFSARGAASTTNLVS